MSDEEQDQATEYLEEVIRAGHVDTYFAPVQDHMTGLPAGYRLHFVDRENPQLRSGDTSRLRKLIRTSPLVGDFDASFRAIGLRAAERAGLPTHTRLFVPTEPASLALLEDRTDEPDRSVILLLDPAEVAKAPAMVLRSARQARALGWGIGLRSVGMTLESAMFLPLVNPSVVCLHRDLVDVDDDAYLGELNRLLQAHVERTGAVILAEGVDSDEHVDLVEAVGARFVTGPRYGDTVPDPEPLASPAEDPVANHHLESPGGNGTPFTIAQGRLRRDPVVLTFSQLRAQLRVMLDRAAALGRSTVVLGGLGEQQELSPQGLERLRDASRQCGFMAMFSGGFDELPVPGIRCAPLDSSDALRTEYTMIVLTSDFTGMVAAHTRPNRGSDGRVEYDVIITMDPDTVVESARGLLSRLRTAD